MSRHAEAHFLIRQVLDFFFCDSCDLNDSDSEGAASMEEKKWGGSVIGIMKCVM